ncbi:hypothetical protein [Streptomyces sp. 061-3]|uniref:hypothetical protein n=1 Tax=Streptomyces sp. 061-3 TaxID=2789268 RepID=UPI0039813EBD
MRKRTTATVVALTAAAFAPLALPATPATAAPATYADDFNGDGYRDLATAAVGATARTPRPARSPRPRSDCPRPSTLQYGSVPPTTP